MGEIIEVGKAVTRFKVGDKVAVGNIIDWCGKCAACLAGREKLVRERPGPSLRKRRPQGRAADPRRLRRRVRPAG
ncbi:alcohol dehydrogenase catalytic domain-containing protein [Streptomyces misionensis]|uniref:alcohol dehydrogenase catalytic domain-containing protein n=1 Tax=Streptomyces misionensis TaxID=67331 RepID=UPI0036F624A6